MRNGGTLRRARTVRTPAVRFWAACCRDFSPGLLAARPLLPPRATASCEDRIVRTAEQRNRFSARRVGRRVLPRAASSIPIHRSSAAGPLGCLPGGGSAARPPALGEKTQK